MDKQPCVYILANKKNGTLYVGVTSDLIKRVWEHKHNCMDGFSKKYAVHDLVWFEIHETMESAISGEKSIKEVEKAMEIGIDKQVESLLAGFVLRFGRLRN